MQTEPTHPATSHFPRNIIPAAIVAVIVVSTGFFGAMALLTARKGNPEFAAVLEEQNTITKAYERANRNAVASATNEGQATAGKAWLTCSRSVITSNGPYVVAHPPSEAQLNRCEADSIQLAASRGHTSTEDISRFLQNVRVVANAAYQGEMARSEAEDAKNSSSK